MASSYTSFRYLLNHSSPARLHWSPGEMIILQRCSCPLLPQNSIPISRASFPEIPLSFLFAITLLCYKLCKLHEGGLLAHAGVFWAQNRSDVWQE